MRTHGWRQNRRRFVAGITHAPRWLKPGSLFLWAAALLFIGLCCGHALAQPVAVAGPAPQAPPPAPPVRYLPTPPLPPPPPSGDGPQYGPPTPYSIGQPTDEEQLYLEFLNRMRADPVGESQRLANTSDLDVLSAYQSFGVNLALLQSEFSTNPPVQPLAMNEKLTDAARWHSDDMLAKHYQDHYQTNGAAVLDPGDRITAKGYTWARYGENVFAYAESVWYGHAGFAVDWGSGVGGMQTPPGHRNSMFNKDFREVGMGVTLGRNGSVGPQLITQDLATLPANLPFITGVVYYDFNGNGFYDLGEGIGGVTVDVPGSAYYAVTADSGGYAVPVTTNGVYSVSFSAGGLSLLTNATIASLKNVKVDYLPAYAPPVLSGPEPASLNHSNLYTFTTVGAATGYDWQSTEASPYTAVLGAEDGLTGLTAVTTPSYNVVDSAIKASGTYSYHLAHDRNPSSPTDEILTLDAVVHLGANAQLSFSKRIGLAFSNEVVRAQISLNGGASWQDVWTQAGNNGVNPVDLSFSRVTVPLSAYAGQSIQARWVFAYSSGYYYLPGDGVGAYLDDLAISDAEQLQNPVIAPVDSGTSLVFYPTNTSKYMLQVRAHLGSRVLNWGPAKTVTVSTVVPAPVIQITGRPAVSGGQVQLDFSVADYASGMTFELWKAGDPTATWTQEAGASLQVLTPNSQFRFTAPAGSAPAFYRIKASY
jgi:hypothetical protein